MVPRSDSDSESDSSIMDVDVDGCAYRLEPYRPPHSSTPSVANVCDFESYRSAIKKEIATHLGPQDTLLPHQSPHPRISNHTRVLALKTALTEIRRHPNLPRPQHPASRKPNRIDPHILTDRLARTAGLILNQMMAAPKDATAG